MAKEDKNGTSTELVVNDQFKGELAEYFGGGVPQQEGIEFRFAQVKIAHQNQAWELPDGDVVKKFKGIILHIQNGNVWWEKSFDETGGNVPPDCYSLNGIKPSPQSNMMQANTCRECKQNVFGSDGKRGKACKNMKRIYVLMDGYELPVRITAPPTSIRAVNEYGSFLANKGIPSYIMVETQFNLKAASNKDGIKYSEINPIALGPSAHSKEQADRLLATKKNFYDLMVGEEFRPEEYEPNEQQ